MEEKSEDEISDLHERYDSDSELDDEEIPDELGRNIILQLKLNY